MKKTVRFFTAFMAVMMLLGNVSASACTGVYVGKEASDQGTIIIARSEDQAWGDVNKRYMVQERVENVPNRYIEDKETGFRLPLPACLGFPAAVYPRAIYQNPNSCHVLHMN